jgi:hypothetical protein
LKEPLSSTSVQNIFSTATLGKALKCDVFNLCQGLFPLPLFERRDVRHFESSFAWSLLVVVQIYTSVLRFNKTVTSVTVNQDPETKLRQVSNAVIEAVRLLSHDTDLL